MPVPVRSGLSWEWPAAVLGGVYAIPAAVVVLNDRSHGFALALGVLPAAIVGLLPTRRSRLAVVVLGACVGLPIFLGGVFAQVPVLAVFAILGLAVGAAWLASRFRLGTLAMSLSLPMFGVGLSYPGASKGAGIAGLMVLGSVYACAISMLWPERERAGTRGRRPGGQPLPLGYGIRLGAAGAAAMHHSRWYVVPAFTTFLVFLLLLDSDPQSAASRFGERVLETLLGVGLAYLFGLVLPSLAEPAEPGK